MINIQLLRENKDAVLAGLQKKGFKNLSLIDEIIANDEQWRSLKHRTDQLRAQANSIAKEVGKLYASGQKEAADQLKAQATESKEEISNLEIKVSELESLLDQQLVQLPNMPHQSVPEGRTPENNLVVKTSAQKWETKPGLEPHWDLLKKWGIIDFELGTKLTGAGFPVYRGKGAKLQRALISFFLDRAIEAGYQEVIPPLLVNEDTAYGTGQLPDKEGQMYATKDDPFFLIPTAEVPVTNLLRDEILEEDQLPVKFCGYTPCFRREAGSYGKDVRGLNRVHQFDKVEIVQVQKPELSYQTLEEMVAHVESLLIALDLPYRILKLCGGDMSFASALTYDFEVFAGAQERWLEVSSVSNFETFQSNRMKLRYRDKDKKIHLAHTLNGSALALPRIVAAIIENNQENGRVQLPKVLVPYTQFEYLD